MCVKVMINSHDIHTNTLIVPYIERKKKHISSHSSLINLIIQLQFFQSNFINIVQWYQTQSESARAHAISWIYCAGIIQSYKYHDASEFFRQNWKDKKNGTNKIKRNSTFHIRKLKNEMKPHTIGTQPSRLKHVMYLHIRVRRIRIQIPFQSSMEFCLNRFSISHYISIILHIKISVAV